MESYEIISIVHDEDGVIVRVGLGHKTYPVQQVVNWIRKKKCGFYTNKCNKRAEIYARKHPISGRWFLTTDPDPDSIEEKNLDFLPQFRTITT